MATFKVNWTLTGSYTVTSKDLEMEPEEAEDIDIAEEIIEQDPLVDVNPMDGKLTLEVTKV